MDLKRLLVSIYFGIENLYYNILDEINKVIPVYKYAIDPLEKNKIPSMPVYLGVMILLILSIGALGAFIVVNNNSNNVNVTVSVVDSLGFKVNDATISYILNDGLESVQTNSNGIAILSLKKGRPVLLQVNADGYAQKTLDFKPVISEKLSFTLTPTAKKEQELSSQFATDDEFIAAGLETPSEVEKRFLEETQQVNSAN